MIKLYGVIGDPISHSMSPLMHNDAFNALSLEGYYQPFQIHPKELETAIKGMKAIGISGFNVTIPHKTNILPLLDRVDPLAKAIGAVNTVVREDDFFVGYNSDGIGFIRSLKENWKQNLLNEKVLLIGAGGAAKAIFYSLANDGVESIDIYNRTPDRANELITECPFQCQSKVLTKSEAEDSLGNYSLIIQTTSIGMSPNINELPLNLDCLMPKTYVVDIIYNPLETLFLREARQKGAVVSNGIGMFVYQGAIAFEKWTGKTPIIERMRKIVLTHLGGKTTPC